MLLYHSLTFALPLLSIVSAQTWPSELVGTWASKSNQTHTGPSFYDPYADKLIEPLRTGISYSFTADGFYEEAYYRAIPNPTSPNCPGGIMQWQHGSWIMLANGSLTLTPIGIDGRQLISVPCDSHHATYTRYNQSELFNTYAVYVDPYHNIPRLDLYQFNGAPLQPLYLVFSPPEMLPTTTLHPPAATTTAASGSKVKRSSSPFEPPEIPQKWRRAMQERKTAVQLVQRVNPDRLWWLGVAMTGVGGALYFGPRFLFT